MQVHIVVKDVGTYDNTGITIVGVYTEYETAAESLKEITALHYPNNHYLLITTDLITD